MERAIIKDKDKTIMLYLNENSKAYGYVFGENGSVTKADNSVLNYLNFLRLSKNMTILPETGKYLVILDNDTNLKHYFLNGVEDFEMLFRNNGELAIDFSAGDGVDENKMPLARRFYIKGVSLLLSLSMALGLSAGLAESQDITINPLTVSNIFQKIDNSNLSTGDKRQFKQEAFFDLLLPYVNQDPVLIKNLEDQLDNLARTFVTDEQFASVAPSVDTSIYDGYINRNEPGVIHMREGLPLNVYIDVTSHEFTALCKAPHLKYNVIGEGMEEQLSFEFFPRTYISKYPKQVEHVRKMVELLGPEALVECFTTGKTDMIEAKFKPILGEQRYEEFLNTLTFKRLPKQDSPMYPLIKAAEQAREEKLDGMLSELAQKMGITFTEEVPNFNPYNVTHNYFSSESIKMSLLKGMGSDLKTAYDLGIIGFARYDDPDKTPISYEEAIKLYDEQDESNPMVTVTYDNNGECSYDWDGAGIHKYQGQYRLVPNVSYVIDTQDAEAYCDDLGGHPREYFIPGGLNVNDNTMRYNSTEDMYNIYWINDKQMQVSIGGVQYKVTPDELKEMFADNPGVLENVDHLLDSRNSNNNNKTQMIEDETMYGASPNGDSPRETNDSIVESRVEKIMKTFAKDFAKYSEKHEEDVAGFKEEYVKFINEVQYDEEYGDKAKKETQGMTADGRYQEFVRRTKEDKSGVCHLYTFRMQEEAEKYGIETYPLFIAHANSYHWAVLEIIDGEYYVCDPTPDIIYGNMYEEYKGNIPPTSFQIPLSEYLKDNPDTFVSENYKGNNKDVPSLHSFPVNDFVEAREVFMNRPDLIPNTPAPTVETENFGVPSV